jgi:heterodisulfide reductase subunit B
MHRILRALGAEVLEWDKSASCCGASLSTTKPEAAMRDIAAILDASCRADAIATVCPMCQLNLEAFQKRAARFSRTGLRQTIIYLPQLMCLAFGYDEDKAMLNKNMALTSGFLEKIRGRGAIEKDDAAEPGKEAAEAG